MRWEPSVRTRHLTVIIALVLAAVGTLTFFNVSRLLSSKLASKRETAEKLVAAYLFQSAQQAILRSPQQDPQRAISEDQTVRSLLDASCGEDKDFAYIAIVSAEGATIAQADPQGLRG